MLVIMDLTGTATLVTISIGKEKPVPLDPAFLPAVPVLDLSGVEFDTSIVAHPSVPNATAIAKLGFQLGHLAVKADVNVLPLTNVTSYTGTKTITAASIAYIAETGEFKITVLYGTLSPRFLVILVDQWDNVEAKLA
jgi:hypothetical protein